MNHWSILVSNGMNKKSQLDFPVNFFVIISMLPTGQVSYNDKTSK